MQTRSLSALDRRRHVRRRLAAPLVVAAAATTLAGCGGSDTPTVTPAASASSGSAPAATSPAASSPAATGTSPSPAAAGRLVQVTFAHNSVTPRGYTATVPLGSKVRLVVHSDVADEVHVHGYDLKQDVAHGVAEVDFTASTPGLFEVELEHRSYTLLHLQVQ